MTSEELESWLKANRAPLEPNQVQDWVFVVRAAAAASDSKIEALLSRMLEQVIPGVSQVRLVETSVEPLDPELGTVTRREQLPGPLPFLKPGEVIWARVQFPVRASLKDVPWIARTSTAGITLSDDPEGADVMLDAVGKPIGAAGDEPDSFDEFFEEVGDKLKEAAQSPLAIGGFLLGGAALYFALRKRS